MHLPLSIAAREKSIYHNMTLHWGNTADAQPCVCPLLLDDIWCPRYFLAQQARMRGEEPADLNMQITTRCWRWAIDRSMRVGLVYLILIASYLMWYILASIYSDIEALQSDY